MQAGNHIRGSSAPLLETLEPRLLLAGAVVTALDAAGNLTITGDAADNQIQVTKTGAKQVTVTGVGGTTVDGAGAKVINTVTGNLKVLMKEGADNVAIGAAHSTFWVGDATPPVGPYGTALNPKDLTVDLGAGADNLSITGLTARNVSIVGGAGNNTIQITDNGDGDLVGDSTRILGNLTVTNGADGGTVTLAGTNILKNCAITIGAGGGTVTFREDTNAAPSFPCWVGGNLTITGGAGDDQIELRSAVGGMPFRVDGNATLNLAAAATKNALILDNVSIGGGLNVTGGAAEDDVTLQTGDLDVAGSVTLNLANGENRVEFKNDVAAWIGRDLTIRGGTAKDQVALGFFLVARNVSITLGAGAENYLDLNASSGGFAVGRNLTVTGGALVDEVTVLKGDSLSVLGNASFNLAAGNNVVDLTALTGLLYVGGNLTCSGAGGTDEFKAGDVQIVGNATFTLGAANNRVLLSSGTNFIAGNLSYTGAGGRDLIEVYDTRVFGSTTLRAGDTTGGTNNLWLNGCNFAGTFSYLGGAGGNYLSLKESSINGTTTITTGNDADEVAIFDGGVFRRLTINTGGGNDQIYLGNDAALAGNWNLVLFKDNVSVNAGAGADGLRLGGTSPDPYTCIFLGDQVKFDGAADSDTLTYDAKYLFLFTPLTPNWETIVA